jgi:hypothetical protein
MHRKTSSSKEEKCLRTKVGFLQTFPGINLWCLEGNMYIGIAPGSDYMILKIFPPKKLAKRWRFDSKQS